MEFAWQVIVVQTRVTRADTSKQQYLSRFMAPRQEELPLQVTISYGDEKVSTPLVQASQPLWNFWTQLSDRGGSEDMVFSLVERGNSSGGISAVQGEARLDLSRFRRVGQSFELWETIRPTKEAREAAAAAAAAADPATAPVAVPPPTAELHLTITYCPTNQDEGYGEDTDCMLCTRIGITRGCTVS